MMQIPTGSFIPGDSTLHHLDARIKILCFLLLLAASIRTSSVLGYLLLAVTAAVMILLSGLSPRTVLSPLIRLWPFFTLIFGMNTLFFDENSPAQWIFHISPTGAAQGANIVARIAFLLIFSGVLITTTAPMELTGALGNLFRPLKLFHIPTENISMIISVAIQFIPTLMEEADTIKKAQTARGARFESRRLTERAASFLPLLVPIFLAAFRRADELSLAMEARGYRGARGRTVRRCRPLRRNDFIALAASASIFLVRFLLPG